MLRTLPTAHSDGMTNTTPHTGARSRRSPAAKLAALTLSLVGVAALAAVASPPSAHADIIGPAPHVEIASGCVAAEFTYVATMTNTGFGITHFDISVNGGSGATVHGYDVASGGTQVATFVVEQGKYSFFDVTNVDDATVQDHQQLTADCKADPYTEIGLVCLHDGTTPFVYLEWVNLSSAHQANFEVLLNGDSVGGGISYGAWNTHYLSFDLFDGQHVAAAILADGVLVEELIADVDCPPVETTTTTATTQPDTTQPTTTLGPVQPDTTAPNSTLAEPPLPTTTDSDPAQQAESATTVAGGISEQLPSAADTVDHANGTLPVTGMRSDALLAIAIKVVLGGLGLVLVGRRFR